MIKQKRGKDKKAVFFSLDALIALSIILLTITVIYPIIRYSEKESSVPEDIISSLSALKIGDMNSVYVKSLITGGNITNLNKSVLEQIGEFYVSNDSNIKYMAKQLAEEVLNTINTDQNIGIWYDTKLLASKNKTSWESAKDRTVERQIISGIQEGSEITGYSARAFLTNSVQTKYYYYGGYVGEGNITVNVEYNGTLRKVELETTANKQFKICINTEPCSSSLEPALSEFEPKYWDLSAAYNTSLKSGIVNTFKIIPDPAGNNLHVAGGYLKLTYSGGVQYEQPVKYYFPGIEGVINLYDGFYSPNTINSMNAYLHFNSSNYTAFLTIGNVTVFSGKEYNEVSIDNTGLITAGLNYNAISNKTVPIRFGLENVSNNLGVAKPVDIAFLIDSTGSMGDDIAAVYKIVNNFTKFLENNSIDFRLALIEFRDYPTGVCGGYGDFSYKIHKFSGQDFTTNGTKFRNEVNTLVASGGADLPESQLTAINQSIFNLTWRNGVGKFDIVLTDAPPHAKDCIKGGVITDENCNLGPKYIANVTKALIKDNITLFLINYPASYTQGVCSNLMDVNMSNMTGGKYYNYTSANSIQAILLDIATKIVSLSYIEQTANVTGNISSILYPDSYIEFNYAKEKTPYGIVITEKENFSTTFSGSFNLPANSSIVETRVISYSGPRWTKEVSVNNVAIYNLSNYGSDYTYLGDPYAINIPNSLVEAAGNINTVRLITGTSPTNTSAGSLSNKIIYTVAKKMESYSAISQHADGCNWTVQFKDNTNLTVEIPAGATEECYYKNVDGTPSIKYETTDALQTAVYKLFKKLDDNNDGKLDIKFEEQNLQISVSEVTGIPFPYETVVQVRKWW